MTNLFAKETLCSSCVHHEVCSKKEEYLAAQKAVDDILVGLGDKGVIRLRDMAWIRPVQLQCDHFMVQQAYRKFDDVTCSTTQRSILDGVITEVRG